MTVSSGKTHSTVEVLVQRDEKNDEQVADQSRQVDEKEYYSTEDLQHPNVGESHEDEFSQQHSEIGHDDPLPGAPQKENTVSFFTCC